MLKSFLLANILSNALYKLYISYIEAEQVDLIWFVWCPSVFLSDGLFFGLLYWIYTGIESSKTTAIVRVMYGSLFMMMNVVYLFALLAASTYLAFTGSMLNFALIGDVGEEISEFGPMLSSAKQYIGVFVLVYIVLYTVIYLLNNMHHKKSKGNRLRKKQVVMQTLLCITYLLLVFVYRPLTPWDAISTNIFLEVLDGPKRDEMPDSIFIQPDSLRDVHDFRFLNTTPKQNTIKNIVWVFIESGRNDLWPMDYNSKIAKEYFNNETRHMKPINPFYSKLVNESLWIQGATTTSSYTIKSLASSLCSMSPLPADFAKERNYPFYKTCLPELLNTHGFSTLYLQPSSINFDLQYIVLEKTGIPWFAKSSIDEGGLDSFGGEKPEEINYFGYQDQVLIPKVIDFIKNSTAHQKPYFLSLLTNANHHPFGTPKNWTMREFTADEKMNQFFNSIAYVDTYLESLISELKTLDPRNETLYIFTGDHGYGLNEYGMSGACGNGYEQAFKITMSLHTENKYFKKILGHQKIFGNYENTDIVPTILDILNYDNFNPQIRLDYGYEGDSLLHAYRPRPTFSYGNPGLSVVVFRENGLKLLLQVDICKFTVYDLIQDPNELNPVDINTNETVKLWVEYGKYKMHSEIKRVRSEYHFDDTPKSTVPVVVIIILMVTLICLCSGTANKTEYQTVSSK
ncbi:alkaline-phosphatase-like protein [Globomyces pollinis-pini]|nr:alkaline-phosphatase-like protein [Globomyces pollinis-pini]